MLILLQLRSLLLSSCHIFCFYLLLNKRICSCSTTRHPIRDLKFGNGFSFANKHEHIILISLTSYLKTKKKRDSLRIWYDLGIYWLRWKEYQTSSLFSTNNVAGCGITLLFKRDEVSSSCSFSKNKGTLKAIYFRICFVASLLFSFNWIYSIKNSVWIEDEI